MANKRQNTDSVDTTMSEKKPRVNEELNGTVFKAMLKDPSKAFKGLTTFIRIAKKLPCDNLYDVVEGYIKISAECAEILSLLEGDRHSEAELMLIFQTLELILLRTASDLSHFSMVGSTVVKKIVSTHIKLLKSSLCSMNYQFVRQCLCLLSAMVSQGADAAREIFSNFIYGKTLSSLARRRDKNGRPDIRMAYIQFVLSFLIYGDNTTVGHVVDNKELLSEFICTGLKGDRISTISLILSTLKTKVILNPAITKTQKVRFFNASILSQIASLYTWNGIVDVATEHTEVMSDLEGGKISVRELVHDFLVKICCSRKHGVSFHDPSLGTSGRPGNIVLLQFAVNLKRATEDELVADLLVSILKWNPDILHRYFKETKFLFTPRVKGAWLDNIALLKKIYQAQPEVSMTFQLTEKVPTSQLLSMVLVTSLPPVCNKAFFFQGLGMPCVVSQHATLSVLAFILKRAQKNIEYCLKNSLWESFDAKSPTAMEEFVQLYKEQLSKILPDVMSIVTKWQALAKETVQDEVKAGIMESETKEATTEEFGGESETKLILLKALLLQVLCLYQRVLPHLINQSKFDFSKLLKGIVSEKGIKTEVPPILQQQILQLALELPPSRFSWFKLQDVVERDQARGERSVLYLLLKMFVSCSSSPLRTSTRMLVLKVLRDSGVFEHTWRELELWLDHLLCLEESQQEIIIQFLDEVLMVVVSDPYVYTDKIASMAQHNVCVPAEMNGPDTDTDHIPMSYIDDVQETFDVVMEDSGKDSEDAGQLLTDEVILQAFPFSVIVPGVLEARNKLLENSRDENGVVCEYVCAVLCDILHFQRDPLVLCLTLHHYDMKLLSAENSTSRYSCLTAFNFYYSNWLPHALQERRFPLAECTVAPSALGFDSFLKACYNEGPDSFLKHSFKQALEDSLCTLQLSQFTRAANQTMLYLRSFVEIFSSLPKGQAGDIVGCLLEVLHALLLKVQRAAEPPVLPQSQGEDEFHLEMNSESVQEINTEQTLVSVFRSVFKHPVLEQWFLTVELGLVPPLLMETEILEKLCSRMTEGILLLLESCAETLGALHALDLISRYMSATQQALLKETQQSDRCLTQESPPLRAFLALHEYMEPSAVEETLSALLQLPHSSLLTERDELNVYGQAILKVLIKAPTSSKNSTPYLTQAALRNLAVLYTTCHSAPLEEFLLQALRREPGSAKLVPTDVLLCCLQQNASLELASVLVQNCSTHCLSFELWCLEHPSFTQITAQDSHILRLLTNYLEQAAIEDPCRPKNIQKQVLQMFCKSLLAEFSTAVLHPEAGVSLIQLVEVLSRLVRLVDMTPELSQLINDLPAVLHEPESYERWQLADCITENLANTQEELRWKRSLVAAAIRWLSKTYKEQKKQEVKTEKAMLQRIKTLLISTENIKHADWNTFVKSGLKYRYQDEIFLHGLNSLLELLYRHATVVQGFLPLETIHMMVTSHSLFLPTMLVSQDEADSTSESKEALVSLLLTLVRKCPEICSSNHLTVILGAYGATLSTTDQKLLLLLKEYESHAVGLVDVQCLLWGAAAVEYHKARKSLGPSLWQQPSSEQLLGQLVTDRMLKTVTHFPLNRHLVSKEDEELIFTEERGDFPDGLCLYDPCFLLPLFSFILRPESVVDCQQFVSSHALGVTVVALSSYDRHMRAAAYHVLGSFYQHLEAACFREKKQLLYLLETVRNGIHKHNIRVSFVHSIYITKMLQQILKPEEHMYLVINRFLSGTQYVDLRRVPEFFKLFYSFDLEHKLEREWVLSVLEVGIRDGLSCKLCEQQSIYHTLLGFCTNPLCDEHVQILIVNVLTKTALVTEASFDLIQAHGILTWIVQLINRPYVDRRLLSAVIELLSALWFTNVGEKESKMQCDSAAQKQSQGSGRWLPLPIISDFLSALLSAIRHLRTGVKAPEMLCLLKILASVLRHHETVVHGQRDAGCLALQPQELSCSAALILLQCWGTLSQDKTLLCALHNLAKKHNIKALLGNVKEKVQGNFVSKAPQSYIDDPNELTEKDKEKHVQSLLECKPLLTSVLRHWKPWPLLPNNPNPNPKALTPPNTNPDLHSGDLPASSNLINATAHTLLKWVLRTLSEQSYDENGTYETVKWLQQVIVPDKLIAECLLTDEALRTDLLTLYHQTCENGAQKHLDTLQIFTTIMVYLLEAERTSSVLHTAVLKACLHPTNEGATREAGLKLLSLYIHEIWKGAEEPQMFLTHVRLVTRHRKKAPKKSTSPIIHICDDVLSAVDMPM